MKLYKDNIEKVDLQYLVDKYPHESRKHLVQKPGHTEHPLLSCLSLLKSNITILDIGTRTGNSALSLSHNVNNKVYSFDINKDYHDNAKKSIEKDNIEFILGNVLKDSELQKLIWKSEIINLDVDPHDGKQEMDFMEILRQLSWRGIVICDDIGPKWPQMQDWWEYEKSINKNAKFYDVTDVGHHSGTGIIDFTGELEII